MDIKSLYTVITNNDGLRALAHFLDKREVKEPSTATLTRLAELVLALNAFSFNGDHYRQVRGVAMGSKMGPNYVYACLFVGFVEDQMLNQYSGVIRQLYRRYIDDAVGAAYRPFSKMATENLNKSKLKTNTSTGKSTLTLVTLPSFEISGEISAEKMQVENRKIYRLLYDWGYNAYPQSYKRL